MLARFVDYYSLFWGPGVSPTIDEPQGVLTCRSSTLVVLADSGPFLRILLTILGSQSYFRGCRTPRCAYVLVVKTRSLGRFCPVSWIITRYRGPEVISTILDPRGAFTCGHQHSQFRPILVRFVHYYSLFWVPERFPRLTIPGAAFTCPSSTLTVLANSDPFHGLLLTVLGSRSDFRSC